MKYLYIILTLLVFSFYYRKTKDPLHPCLVFLCIWFGTCAISCTPLLEFSKPWCVKMHVVTILSGISFFGGSLYNISAVKRRILRNPETVSQTFIIISRCLLYISLTCFFIEYSLSNQTFLSVFSSDDFDKKTGVAIPFIHYGTLFLPFIPTLLFYEFFNKKNKKKRLVFWIFAICFIEAFINVSRGSLLVILLSFVYLFSRYNAIQIKKLLLWGSLIVALFIGIGMLRINSESIVFTATSNKYFSALYSYISTCYANLNDYIIANHPYHLQGSLTFAPIWTLLGLRDSVPVIETSQLGIFNACTYLYGFYHDFKMLGIIIFPLLIGLLLSLLYRKAAFSYSLWIIPLAMLQKAVFVPFFGNYFTGELVILFPYLLSFFILYFCFHYKLKIVSKVQLK